MTAPIPPAHWPIPLPTTVLKGHLVRLEPLTEDHIPELQMISGHEDIWTYTSSRAVSEDAMRHYVTGLLREYSTGASLPFAVRQEETSCIVGATRLKKLSRANASAMVGSWYTPAVWRTGVNVEAKLLLLSLAFERLGCIRVEFQTDRENERSCNALLRLGATQEGVLRAHQVTREGRRRDSVVFSVLDHEWPAVRGHLEGRLQR